jgi:hypothetical protein
VVSRRTVASRTTALIGYRHSMVQLVTPISRIQAFDSSACDTAR